MSSDETPIRVRTRRRRNLDLEDQSPAHDDGDIFNPGPIHAWPALPVDPQTQLPIPEELRNRVRTMRRIDKKAATEFILRTLHSFLIAHRPLDEIARAFGVTSRMVRYWRTELNRRMVVEFKAKTPMDLLVEQIGNHTRARAYAWQQASRATDHADKCRWINTAMKADSLITDLYARVGLIDATQYKPAVETEDSIDSNAAILARMAKQFLSGEYAKKKGALPLTTEQDITNPIDDRDYLL